MAATGIGTLTPAIVGSAFLDALIEHMLINFPVDDEQGVRRPLRHDQSMGAYGSRTTAVYCLGVIGKVIREDLRLVGKTRNRFAHDLKASFDEEPVRPWFLSLKWHEVSMFRKPPEGATPRDSFRVG